MLKNIFYLANDRLNDDQWKWIAKCLKYPGKTPDHQNDICNHGNKKNYCSHIFNSMIIWNFTQDPARDWLHGTGGPNNMVRIKCFPLNTLCHLVLLKCSMTQKFFKILLVLACWWSFYTAYFIWCLSDSLNSCTYLVN